MSDQRIPLTFTPSGLDTVAMALQALQAQAGATIADIRAQLQAAQAAPLTPTNDEAPQEAAGLQDGAEPQAPAENAS